jgi:hypothetical protein
MGTTLNREGKHLNLDLEHWIELIIWPANQHQDLRTGKKEEIIFNWKEVGYTQQTIFELSRILIWKNVI